MSPTDPSHGVHPAAAVENQAEQGEQGNMKQNTNHGGSRQDR